MLLILILSTIFATALAYQWRNRQKLPKGPIPLPVIGNFHQFLYYGFKFGNAVSVFHHFEKIYGKVFTIWMGPLPTVYISDYEVANETHIKRAHQFSKRFTTGTLNYIREGRGIITSNGDFWQDHRRFALQTLRGFGLGRNIMEDKVMEEFRYRINDYNKTHSKNGAIEIHTGTFFDLLVGSIINQLLIGERFEQNDKEFEKLKNSLASALENFSMVDIFFPTWFLNSPLMRWRQKKVFEPFDYILEMTNKNINERVNAIEKGDHVIEGNGEDFLDAYLVKIEKDEREGVQSTFNLTTLSIDISDLWQAGQETTSTTMTWACACFLNNPRIVPRVREELWKVTAGNRSLSLCDRPDTPFFNATLHEVQRFASIFNFNLFRHIEEDTVVAGQPLAAGTALTTQLCMLHTDEKLFKKPNEFRPERFIEDATLEKKLIPFGIGKRACPGESLARAELYLILGNLIMEYEIKPCGPIPPVRTIAPFGLLNRPPHFNVRFEPVKV